MPFELDAVSFDYLTVKVRGAKQVADGLARDRADHQQRNEVKLMSHLKHNQDRRNRRTNDRAETCAHSCNGQRQLIALSEMKYRCANRAENKSGCRAKK